MMLDMIRLVMSDLDPLLSAPRHLPVQYSTRTVRDRSVQYLGVGIPVPYRSTRNI